MIILKGIEKIQQKLEDMSDSKKVEKAVHTACNLIEDEAKHKAPKDTGALRRSIANEVKTEGNDIVGIVYTPLEYAPYVEYGTGLFSEKGGRTNVPWKYKDDEGNWHSCSGQHPQPFFRPALDENKDEVMELIKGAVLDD